MPAPLRVSVIGQGPMGVACAQRLLGQGAKVTVWNRTAEKCAPAVAAGASQAASAIAALEASPVTILFLSTYAAVRAAMLDEAPIRAALAGRTLAVLCAGQPEGARDTAAALTAVGATVVDGFVFGAQDHLAKGLASVFYCGPGASSGPAAPVIDALSERGAAFVGEEITSAKALELGTGNFVHTLFLGFMSSKAITEPWGVSNEHLTSAMTGILPVMPAYIADRLRRASEDKFDEPGTEIGMLARNAEKFVDATSKGGLDTRLAELRLAIIKEACEIHGTGADISATVDVFRGQGKKKD